ncbi:hypothetical protein D3C75_831270 [compost metagenome]
MQAILAYFLQIIQHRLRSVRAAAEGQRVDKDSHCIVRIHANTAADRCAYPDFLLPAVFREQNSKAAQQQHVRRNLVGLAERLQRAADFPGPGKRAERAGKLLERRTPEVGWQIQQLVPVFVLLQPKRPFLLPERRIPVLLPDGVILVLYPGLRKRPSLVIRQEIPDQQFNGQPVRDDMVHINLQHMAFVRYTHQPYPQQRSLIQPERLHEALQRLFHSGPRQFGVFNG